MFVLKIWLYPGPNGWGYQIRGSSNETEFLFFGGDFNPFLGILEKKRKRKGDSVLYFHLFRLKKVAK